MKKVLLSSPQMGGYEMKYIQEAFDKNWIAPLGENVDMFEKTVKEYIGIEEALALSSGTAALHLALKILGVKENDYVFCSSLTFSASCNPILYEKAKPVFIDSDEESWNMDPNALKQAMEWANEQGCLPKAVIVVDLYGQSAKYDEICAICETYQVPILEDAAEALGASYHGRNCGTFGQLSALSFNGNKIITTSGGGMVLCHDDQTRHKMFFWATQAREQARHYEHKELGYNYRMSNICAGIGRGQMHVLDERIAKKREIYRRYQEALKDYPITMMNEMDDCFSTHWLSVLTIHDDCAVKVDQILDALHQENVESRPVWKPMHMQPLYQNYKFFTCCEMGSVSQRLFERGICLPSDTNMSEEEQMMIIDIMKAVFDKSI